MNSTFLHVSGLCIQFDATSGIAPFIASMRCDSKSITALDEGQTVKWQCPTFQTPATGSALAVRW